PHHRCWITKQGQHFAERADGMADRYISAFRRLISGSRHLEYLPGNTVGELRPRLSNPRASLNGVRCGDHDGSLYRGEILLQDCRELVLSVSARELREHESRIPLEDLVLMIEQSSEEAEVRIQHIRALLTDEAQGFRAAVLDARLRRLQALG